MHPSTLENIESAADDSILISGQITISKLRKNGSRTVARDMKLVSGRKRTIYPPD